MSWTVEYVPSLLCVEYVFTGDTSGRDIKQATSKGIALGKEYGTNLYLVNLENMEGYMSIMDILELPELQYVNEGLNRRSRIAVVMPNSSKEREIARFYETVSINRGWQVKNFDTRDKAIDWLVSARPSS